ncbi:hypothetical protein Gohar_004821 [Gossypium harknessii]|uniref:Uncharacterized protein n=1 Tax=Gossypium harknessii TaxID=34285 RepID=A0A7J9H646_9ROSI|nr:hypothetical protein [Gossypium harknessii]
MAPEVLDKEHKINLRRLNTYWLVFHAKYMKIWENQYDNIPTDEPIIVSELACDPNYMSWFRIHGKPYLLLKEKRRRAYAITDPNGARNDAYTTAPSDYVKCVS